MRVLAVLLAMMPGLATAGGVPAGGFVAIHAPATVQVQVRIPCRPEDRFKLCPVPVPDMHQAGYLPRTVPSTARLVVGPPIDFLLAKDDRFSVFVTPNIVPYEEAIMTAAGIAAAHCGRQGAEVVVARIDERHRHAPEDLESWKFGGTCE